MKNPKRARNETQQIIPISAPKEIMPSKMRPAPTQIIASPRKTNAP